MVEPKILTFDIETSHMVAATFGLWKADIPYDHIIHDWRIFSAAWKWLGNDTVYSASQAEYTEEEVIHALTSAIQQADIVVGHNIDRFDLKKLNTRVFLCDRPPFFLPTSVDTYKVAKKEFAFSSNRLDYIAKALGVGGKTSTPTGLWLKALFGDKEAFTIMEEYNRNDVVINEKVYLKMRPFIRNHPDVSQLTLNGERLGCPSCGSEKIIKYGTYKEKHGGALKQKRRYQRHQCTSCRRLFLGAMLKGDGN